MKVYVLDWGGTLDRITNPDDPYTFVQALKTRGDFVVFHSGGYVSHLDPAANRYSRAQFNLVERTCDYSISKTAFTKVLREIMGIPDMFGIVQNIPNLDRTAITEIVVSDDHFDTDENMMRFFASLAEVPVRYVYPEDLVKEMR